MASWDITGNNGTNPNDNFLGTIDNEPLVIRTHNANVMRISEDGKLVIVTGSGFDPVIPYTWFTVTGDHATPDIGTKEVMRIMRHGVPGVVNQNSASFCLGAFEPGIEQRSRLDIKVAGLPNNSNVWGSVPDVTVMSLQGDGSVGIGTTTPNPNNALHVHQTGSHATGILAESDTGAGLAAVTSSPDFVALSAENRQGSAFRAFGSETRQFSIGIEGRGLTAVSGESQNGTGILGTAHSQQSPNVSGVGVFGQCLGKPGIGVYGYSAFGTGVIAIGGAQAAGGDGLFATTDFGWCGKFVSSDTRSLGGVYVSVPAGQPGLQVASGTKSAIVPTSQGSRSLYSEEATEVWFTDYGFGQLQAGRASVSIDPLFAETVNLNEPYHVFVQLNDAAAEGAAVINKTATVFEVRELRNGSSDAAFSYRLVAKRKAYEQHRLEQASDAADDPNLYPEKRSEWDARHRFDVPAVVPGSASPP